MQNSHEQNPTLKQYNFQIIHKYHNKTQLYNLGNRFDIFFSTENLRLNIFRTKHKSTTANVETI